jgi:hypothetical protein
MEQALSEKRKLPRQRVFRGAVISFHYLGATVECVVRNLSECGIRCIADRIPTQAGQHSDDCGQPMMVG